jgi:membrane fusion protein (multidrug efflux system)
MPLAKEESAWEVAVRRAWLTLILLWVVCMGAAAAELVVLVATRRVEPGPYDLTLPQKVGLLQASEHRLLAFEVAGRLEELAPEGEPISAGEVVAALDTVLEAAQLRRAEIHLAESRRQLVRVRGLRSSRAASQKALDVAITAVALRTVELEIAGEQLARRHILAPFDGIVVDSHFESGEVVSPGSPVVSFMDLSTLRLELGVPGYQVGRVEEGVRAVVTVPALEGKSFEARVHRVASAAAKSLSLFEVEVRVPNPDGRLRPGMSARVHIVTESLLSAVAVPLDSSILRDGERVVFFVEDGRARAVSVSAPRIQGSLLVLPGPLPYRELVLRGQRDLRDGIQVRIDNAILEGLPDAAAEPVSVPGTPGPAR